MCAWKYKQLMPRITVEKLKLIEQKRITNLIGMSLHHISSELEKTPYKAEISELGAEELNSISLEKALINNFLKCCKKIIELSPKDVRSLVSSLLMKHEANSMKALFKAKKANLSVEEALDYIIPIGKLTEGRCTRILENSENTADIIYSFAQMEYGTVLENAFEDYLKTENFYLLEVALDRYVYSKIWRATRKLWGLDNKIARTVIGLEIDLINLKTVLRCKAMGVADNQIRRYLIPVSEIYSKEEFEAAIRNSDIPTIINSLVESAKRAMARDHLYIFKELLDLQVTSLTTIEKILDRGLLETNLRMIKRYTPFFNIGLLLAFLNLKWFEVKNLRAIIRGAEASVAPEKVKNMLILQR